MPTRNDKPEQIVAVLRQIEVQMANGKTAPRACKEAGIHTQSYYRWRKEYGGLKLDQAKRLKELRKENARLKRLVAELSLEKQAGVFQGFPSTPSSHCYYMVSGRLLSLATPTA